MLAAFLAETARPSPGSKIRREISCRYWKRPSGSVGVPHFEPRHKPGNRRADSTCLFPVFLLLRRNSSLRRRLRAENALEAFAILKEDQHPQCTSHQSPRNARRRKRQVKRKDVVQLRRQHCQRKWHEVARKQQQSAQDLHGEKERSKMRLADGDKKLNRERIRQGRLGDEVKKSVQPKDRKHQAQ